MNNDYAHLISIIVPAYNVSTTIERTLNTLTAQTYSPFEIIVVNDASTDNTEQVARDFLSRSDSDFRIIAHTVNKGVSAARNTGLKAAHGRYVWFIDADDIADKNFLALLHEKAEKENADVVLGSYRIYFEREDYYRIRCIKLKREFSSARDYFPAWLLRKIPSNIWCCLFRRDFITDNMLSFPEGCHSGEDEEFLVKALIASRRTCFVKKPLYVQIDHERPEDMFKPQREEWSIEEGSPKPQFRTVSVTNINRAFLSAKMASVIADTWLKSLRLRRQAHMGQSRSLQKFAFTSLLPPPSCSAKSNHEAQSRTPANLDGDITDSSSRRAASKILTNSRFSIFLLLQGRLRLVPLRSTRISPVP